MSLMKIGRALRAVASLSAGAVVLCAGCLSSTEPSPSEIQMIGVWRYVGVQTAPVRENLTGDLRITSESGTSFQGRLDIIGVNEATGQTRVLEGSVSGTSDAGNVVDFDANVEATARRHVGQIVADTITGTWVGSSSGGVMSSGTFRAERSSQ